jgi:hypothetical protein
MVSTSKSTSMVPEKERRFGNRFRRCRKFCGRRFRCRFEDEIGFNAEPFKCRQYGGTEGFEQALGGNVHVKEGFVANDFPTQLIFIKKDGAAARVLRLISMPSFCSILPVSPRSPTGDIPPGHFWVKTEGSGWCWGYSLAFQFQQGFVKGHVFGGRHGRRIKESPGFHC